MKKLILGIVFSVLFISSYSQALLAPIGIAGNGLTANHPYLMSSPQYGYFWGDPTRDTCVASSTLSFYIKMPNIGFTQVKLYPYVHKVSGTVTNKIYIYGSGYAYPYNWEKRDSITVTNASTGYITSKTITNWLDPYMKIEVNAGAVTQKADYKVPINVLY